MEPSRADTLVRLSSSRETPRFASGRRAAPRGGRPIFLGTLREAGLTILALAGSVSLLWMIISNLFGLSLITFATGSMSPTIPTGSLGIVREIPASELRIGDVATLQRGGERLPVTHRVVSVEPSTSVGGATAVTMQGDDNPIADVFPYHVDSAKLLLFSIDNGAYVVDALTQPLMLSMGTLAIGGITLWAFWPRLPSER